MQRADRYMKIMLTLLVVGIWGHLVSPVFAALPAFAQSKHKAGTPAAASYKSYAVVAQTEKGELVPNGAGSVILGANDMAIALHGFPAQGWKLHSVVPSTSGSGNGIFTGYVVILEK